MTFVIVCETTEQEGQLVHKCYDYTIPVDTKMVELNLRGNARVGECYEIGPDASIELTFLQLTNILQNGVTFHWPDFQVNLIGDVLHITTEVTCHKKGSLGVLEGRFGGRPFSWKIGFVRDPQGLLKESYKIGKQHKVVLRYAPLPEVQEVFEIVEAYEFGYSDVKMSSPKEKWDEDDKENKKKRKTAPKGKAGKNGGRKALECC
ncbi:unnamed protein product [Caenorhabditis brenneri]